MDTVAPEIDLLRRIGHQIRHKRVAKSRVCCVVTHGISPLQTYLFRAFRGGRRRAVAYKTWRFAHADRVGNGLRRQSDTRPPRYLRAVIENDRFGEHAGQGIDRGPGPNPLIVKSDLDPAFVSF
jgi:hypothetical protein